MTDRLFEWMFYIAMIVSIIGGIIVGAVAISNKNESGINSCPPACGMYEKARDEK